MVSAGVGPEQTNPGTGVVVGLIVPDGVLVGVPLGVGVAECEAETLGVLERVGVRV